MRWMCFFVLAGCVVAFAGEGWSDWEKRGDRLMDAGRFEDAKKAYKNALVCAEASHAGNDVIVLIRNSLVTAYAQRGEFAQAEVESRRVLDLERRLHGPQSLEYAVVFASMSLLPMHSGNRDAEIDALRAAIERGDESGAQIANAKDYLGKLLYNDRRFSEAEAVLEEAQASYARSEKQTYWLGSELLNDLGVIREHQGRFSEAADLDTQAIDLIEAQFGAECSSMITPLNNLATMYARMGRLEEAEKVYQRAAELCVRLLGPEHPTYGALLGNEAAVLRKLGRKKESKVLAAQSQRIEEDSNRRNGVGATVEVSALRAGN